MQDAKIKLQNAFNKGFVPKDLREAMAARGHVGQVWVVENDEEARLGVGYKLVNDDLTEQNHIHWYEPEEVQEILKEL